MVLFGILNRISAWQRASNEKPSLSCNKFETIVHSLSCDKFKSKASQEGVLRVILNYAPGRRGGGGREYNIALKNKIYQLKLKE